MTSATPFLMFQGGVAREAMELYTSLFDDGEIVSADTYGADGPGPEGTVMRAHFRLAGQDFFASDSFVTHAFDFTPSLSIWIQCETEEQLTRLFDALAEGGQPMMPLGGYGFSDRFGWVNDRYGVSWQLNLGGVAAA
ncbi:VOC family protein [Nocardioides sp. YIM 152588]|uniref:VOC family protein n=1 Tax=Nocardioides sp. YIM 152588 TaxID=3158259 RepID=UPI0032E47ABA